MNHLPKHTPAPWGARIDRTRKIRQVILPIGRSDEVTLARVTGPMNPDEADANARLMAAAPQMYRALLDAAEALDARPLPRSAQELRARAQMSVALLLANPDLMRLEPKNQELKGQEPNGPTLDEPQEQQSPEEENDPFALAQTALTGSALWEAECEARDEEERADEAFRASHHAAARALIDRRLLEEAEPEEQELPFYTIQWMGEDRKYWALVHIQGGSCLRAIFECRSPDFRPIGVYFE